MDTVDYCVEVTDGRVKRPAGDWMTADSVAAMEALVAEAFSAFRTLQQAAPAFAGLSITCQVRPSEGSAWRPGGVVVSP